MQLKPFFLTLAFAALIGMSSGCEKFIETGFQGEIFEGKGDCMPGPVPALEREFKPYTGTVYFIPAQGWQALSPAEIELKKAEAPQARSRSGRLRVALDPGYYEVCTEKGNQTFSNNRILIQEGEIYSQKIYSWQCTSF